MTKTNKSSDGRRTRTKAKVDPQDPMNIKFINGDLHSSSPVDIRVRGDQAFIESDEGCIRIGIGFRTDKQSGETRPMLYKHMVDKRENVAAEATSF